jgi:hypothetical protein
MIKSLAALAVFAVLGASVIALPGFAPKWKPVRPLRWQRQIGLQFDLFLRTASSKFGRTSPPRAFETAVPKQRLWKLV